MTVPSPQAQWHPLWSLFTQSFIYMLFPIAFLGISSLLGYMAISQMFYSFNAFLYDVQSCNSKRYL
jgi:hypothetical protein